MTNDEFKDKLWEAADKLLGSVTAAQYKHPVERGSGMSPPAWRHSPAALKTCPGTMSQRTHSFRNALGKREGSE